MGRGREASGLGRGSGAAYWWGRRRLWSSGAVCCSEPGSRGQSPEMGRDLGSGGPSAKGVSSRGWLRPVIPPPPSLAAGAQALEPCRETPAAAQLRGAAPGPGGHLVWWEAARRRRVQLCDSRGDMVAAILGGPEGRGLRSPRPPRSVREGGRVPGGWEVGRPRLGLGLRGLRASSGPQRPALPGP